MDNEFRRSTMRFNVGIRISKINNEIRRMKSNFEDRQRGSTPNIEFRRSTRGSTPTIEFRRSTMRFDSRNRSLKINNEVRPLKPNFEDRPRGSTLEWVTKMRQLRHELRQSRRKLRQSRYELR